MTPRRIRAAEIPDIRENLRWAQDDCCAICGGKFYDKMPLDPVLDHDHKTGKIRGVLHRGCNSLLGKIENGAPRAWVKNLAKYCLGAGAYLGVPSPAEGLLHSDHRTPTEKAVRARKRRAAARKPKVKGV